MKKYLLENSLIFRIFIVKKNDALAHQWVGFPTPSFFLAFLTKLCVVRNGTIWYSGGGRRFED